MQKLSLAPGRLSKRAAHRAKHAAWRPQVGAALVRDSVRYTVEAISDTTRPAGEYRAQVCVLAAGCATCGAGFRTKAAVRQIRSGGALRRHCDAHTPGASAVRAPSAHSAAERLQRMLS